MFSSELGGINRSRDHLQIFLLQTLEQDQSCQNAVNHVLSERLIEGKTACSVNTGPYCKARKRLSTALIKNLTQELSKAASEKTSTSWLWKGYHVKLVDGTTVSMPDTAANQAAYPQHSRQKEGVGFPIARLVGVLSLSTGFLLDLNMGPYRGKQTGEHALFRGVLSCLTQGDLLLGDRYYCSYFLIAQLQELGVHFVFEQHAKRKSDFRCTQEGRRRFPFRFR